MNDLETALADTDDGLDSYLSNTDVPQFRADLKELLARNAEVKAFKQKIIALIQKA